ncbi:MAG: exodeoxyribonuclease V subunit alpha, partial [Pseudomonadota bacterium]
MSLYQIETLLEAGFLSELDVHFARFMARLDGLDSAEFLLAAALLSQWRAQGHTCLDLSAIANQSLSIESKLIEGYCPPLDHWLDVLRNASTVGVPGDYHPMILDPQNRLYLHRYQRHEAHLASFFKQKISATRNTVNSDDVLLDKLFPDNTAGEQRQAVKTALRYPFCIITGGPGTGKTSTVVKILAMLVSQSEQSALRISLAAPTGKAVARLRESIRRARNSLPVADETKLLIPDQAVTLHRLLEISATGPSYHADNPLAVDVVVVDEASMVDMMLMHLLVNALPQQARLILLGDKDQLASVEAGAVLNDLCHIPAHVKKMTSPESHYVTTLTKSYRFDSESGIGRLAALVNQGDEDDVVEYLTRGESPELNWIKPEEDAEITQASLESLLNTLLVQGFSPYLKTLKEPASALNQFEQFRVLCAHRQGVGGVSQMNVMIEQLLRRTGHLSRPATYYEGRPVMVTENDYQLSIFNG